MERLSLKLSEEALDLAACYHFVTDASCGAAHIFVGTVRKHNFHKEVLYLEFEAYENMAFKEMEKIAKEAFAKWPCAKLAIHHRIGRTHIQEEPLIIALSAPHSKEAFEACAFLVQQLKTRVPIWKKEYYKDGAVWIGAAP